MPDLDYIFAPLKHARLDYMAQKAVEMGARRLRPALTRRSQASRVNLDRMRANVVEAAEQCGLLALAEVLEEERLEVLLRQWPEDRLLIFCDEAAEIADPLEALRAGGADYGKFAVLIGPEGGFDEAEREMLARIRPVVRLSLGPRVLRADTAAVAALALVQAVLGDWRGQKSRDDMISPSCWGQKGDASREIRMTAKKQEQPASFRLIACAALALSPLFGATSMAADNHFRIGAPFPQSAPEIGGETRIPAARPAVSPGYSSYGQSNDGTAESGGATAGRLRLRPQNFGGL